MDAAEYNYCRVRRVFKQVTQVIESCPKLREINMKRFVSRLPGGLVLLSALVAAPSLAQDGPNPFTDFDAFDRGMQQATWDWINVRCSSQPARPQPSNETDAFGHCWAGCTTARACGDVTCLAAGWFYEDFRDMQDFVRWRDHDSSTEDRANQIMGGTSAVSPGETRSCFRLCEELARDGRLAYSAPQRRWYDCADRAWGAERPCTPFEEIEARHANDPEHSTGTVSAGSTGFGAIGGLGQSIAASANKAACKVELIAARSSLDGNRLPGSAAIGRLFEACKLPLATRICELDALIAQPPPPPPINVGDGTLGLPPG